MLKAEKVLKDHTNVLKYQHDINKIKRQKISIFVMIINNILTELFHAIELVKITIWRHKYLRKTLKWCKISKEKC